MPLFSSKIFWVVLVITVTATLIISGKFWTAQRTEKPFPDESTHSTTQGFSNDTGTSTTEKNVFSEDGKWQNFHNRARVASKESPSLKTVEERQRYYDGLLKEDPETVWQEWKQLLNGDGLQREYAKNALAAQLQKGGHEEIYLEADGLLIQASLSAEQKASLVNLLTETATPKALEVLINALKDESSVSLRTSLRTGIEKMGDNRWEARFHPELSAPLEKAWVEFTDDPFVSASLARGIAKAGAPNGIAMLLETIANNGATLADISKNPQGSAALSAMGDIRNPAAVSVLAKTLTNYNLDDPTFIAAGDGLAAMGSPEATNVLLSWAKQAPDAGAPLVKTWFSDVSDEKSLNLLRAAISPSAGATFISARVKESIAEIVRTSDDEIEIEVLR